MNYLLCLGLGYSAAALCRRWTGAQWHISGTSRSAAGAERLSARGWNGVVFAGDGRNPTLSQRLAEATHLLVSAGPDESDSGPTGGDPLLRWYAEDVAAAPKLQAIAYLSTVGVYGDHQGGWVDETTACRPRSSRSLARLAAERAWLALGHRAGKPVSILRLAGIYGPGRNALENILAGEARRIIKPGQVFNRIHVDDIATTIATALMTPTFSGIVNVTDNEPAPPQDVIAHAAALLKVNPPPEVAFTDADLSPMARSFYGENKRVANRRLTQDLGVQLRYPTYRQGLAGLLAEIQTRRP